jgi:hypothetical protein
MACCGRPALALRVGITGTRDVAPDQAARLAGQLAQVLEQMKSLLRELAAADAAAAAVYRHGGGGAPEPWLRFVSPLARGADRLAAESALAAGYGLHVPMPFPKAVYEQDFDTPEDLAEFRRLLAHAGPDWLELDGDRQRARQFVRGRGPLRSAQLRRAAGGVGR